MCSSKGLKIMERINKFEAQLNRDMQQAKHIFAPENHIYFLNFLTFLLKFQTTGLYDRLEQKKVVMSEPKASEKIDFDQLLKSFYEVIEESENRGQGHIVTFGFRLSLILNSSVKVLCRANEKKEKIR